MIAWDFFPNFLQYVRQGSKYPSVLNMLQIMNMSGFLTCQGLQYNEKRLMLEQATLIFEFELYF